MAWDSEEIRKEREFGWFREHERELIENARRRRLEAEQARRLAAGPSAEGTVRRCPRDAAAMQTTAIEDVEVDRCPVCEGLFFDRGELETVLLRHDGHRKGFFRQLLGLREPAAEHRG